MDLDKGLVAMGMYWTKIQETIRQEEEEEEGWWWYYARGS